MGPDCTFDLYRHSKAWGRKISKKSLENALHKAAYILNLKGSFELTIVLADNDFIQPLNAQYRRKDKPTDVLSFPQQILKKDQGLTLENLNLGDIILSYETIEQDAINQQKSFVSHTLHMVVHGFLHLLGYDHLSTEDATHMESLEVKILDSLGIANPYE